MTTAPAIDIHRAAMPHTTIVEAWSAVMEDVRSVGKDDYNDQQRYKFRGIDAVVNAVGPALRKHGVIITPRLVEVDYSDATVGQKQTRMSHARVIVEYTARSGTEQLVIGEVPGEAMDVGDKAVAKAMSVAYRIALLQSLTLPTDDPDPDDPTGDKPASTRRGKTTPKPADDGPVAPPATVTMRRRTNEQPPVMKALMAAFTTHGLGGKDQSAARHMFAEHIIGRPLESSNDLNPDEAKRIIDHLDKHGANLEGTS